MAAEEVVERGVDSAEEVEEVVVLVEDSAADDPPVRQDRNRLRAG